MLPSALTHYFSNFVGLNSGIMLTGSRGAGKSGVLNFLNLWAIKNDWIVAPLFKSSTLTKNKTMIRRHNITGLYLQNDLAVEWLKDFK